MNCRVHRPAARERPITSSSPLLGLVRQTGDRMAAISMQQGKEAAGAAYAAAGTSIAGDKTALGINNQGTQLEFTGRVGSAEITHRAAIDSARLQADLYDC